ncbi:threonylcarbamoyl-AMP synthase-like [Mytilus edulis]|uniref:threonylcarbamoyl-AMP synthase-like n=1 Tax=Mytilus edulis TaxID=6550 RepID=UPI0039EFAE28
MITRFQTFVKLLSVSRPYISTMNKIVKVSENELHELVSVAVNSLKAGNIIAVPTDTIYGVAGLVQNSEAVDRLYSVKNRDYNKPVAISVADISDVYRWGQVTVPQALLAKLLPGPVTVVLNRTTDLNPELNPKTSLVGIRIPDHEFIREVARSCQEPLALTSANISSAQSTLRVEEFENLWPKLDKIFDDGMLGDTFHSRQGSTVVDLSKKGVYKIIRDGSSLKNTVQVLSSYGLTDDNTS